MMFLQFMHTNAKKMNVFEKPHVLNIIKKPSNNLSKDKMQHKVCARIWVEVVMMAVAVTVATVAVGDGIGGRGANEKKNR